MQKSYPFTHLEAIFVQLRQHSSAASLCAASAWRAERGVGSLKYKEWFRPKKYFLRIAQKWQDLAPF
jgi:hypothetical protein